MPTVAARAHQAFPVLDKDQIVSARRFAAAEERRFEPVEAIYRTGDKNVPAWLILEGNIELSRHDGLRDVAPVTRLGSGQFTGEVGQLSGAPRWQARTLDQMVVWPCPSMQRIFVRWSWGQPRSARS
jgi:thioredoxin reductase (NADPH)